MYGRDGSWRAPRALRTAAAHRPVERRLPATHRHCCRRRHSADGGAGRRNRTAAAGGVTAFATAAAAVAVRASAGRTGHRRLRQHDPGAVLELIGAVDHHRLAGCQPLVIATSSPAVGPAVTGRMLTVLSALTRYT